MIAGCYVPFTLVTLKSRLGLILLITVTGLALLGIFLKILCFKRSEKFCLALYIVMGWMIAIAIEPLFRALPFGGMALLVSGGISYSLGVPFFKADHIPFNHAIWHGFVLTGSVCHYLCVLYYVLPLLK
jgi:hemolysin III